MDKVHWGKKARLGAVFASVFPRLAVRIANSPEKAITGGLKQVVIEGLEYKYTRENDHDGLSKLNDRKWQAERGTSYHAKFAHSERHYFQEHHAEHILPQIARLLDDPTFEATQVVDFGCGDGRVLAYMAGKLSGFPKGVGLDISRYAIEFAKEKFGRNSALEFIEGDAFGNRDLWLRPGTIFTANGGVLEYFSETEVLDLFKAIAAAKPAAVIIAEPISPDVDLGTQTGSVIFGGERTFSHNYPAHLAAAGCAIFFEEDKTIGPKRWLMVGGVST